MLLMLLVMNEKLQELVRKYFKESGRVGDLVENLVKGINVLENGIKQYA